MKRKSAAATLEETLRAQALAYPGATEHFPWGERAIKVKGKVFLFMRLTDDGISLSLKLPRSRDLGADLPFAQPTGYGLGKHGWITASVPAGDRQIAGLLKEWIDESYRAIAPKTFIRELDSRSGAR